VLSIVAPRLDEGAPLVAGRSGTLTVIGESPEVESVTVAPDYVELRPNDVRQFMASVVSNGTGLVAWSVLEGATHGAIDQDGWYRSPLVLPAPPRATIVATSLDDDAVWGAATIDLRPALDAGALTLAAWRNPANPGGLLVMVCAAEPFLAAPVITVNGQAWPASPAQADLSAYRAHGVLSAGTIAASIHATGTTSQGEGEAQLDLDQ